VKSSIDRRLVAKERYVMFFHVSRDFASTLCMVCAACSMICIVLCHPRISCV